MAKVRVRADSHPGDAVMQGIDAAVQRIVDAQPEEDRERSLGRQEAFIEEMRRLGRDRRDRRQVLRD